MSKPASSGIRTKADGQSFIPSSRRADGTTRKEIKVRPGYKPPEDVETYKSRTVEGWRHGSSTVPGTEAGSELHAAESKNKNAKRREAARKKKEESTQDELDVGVASMTVEDKARDDAAKVCDEQDDDQERQKKIRNALKKLRAVKELKAKKADGEKLSADQLVKISKEGEILRDLRKLGHEGTGLEDD